MTSEVEDLLKERERFLTRIRDAARRAAVESEQLAAPDPKDLLQRYIVRLEEATRAKKDAIARYDEEIQHYEGLIGNIKKELSAKRAEKPEAPPKRAAAAATTTRPKSAARRKATKGK